MYNLQMTSGRFIPGGDLESVESEKGTPASQPTQVALGSETGAVYLMTNFEVRV